MKHDQALSQIVNELPPEFVSNVSSISDPATLRKMKNSEVDPDRRELIQARADLLYRQSVG